MKNAPRLLVIEDDALIADGLERCLTLMGYEVVASAAEAEEAIYLAQVHKPDLILSDIQIGGSMDGIEVAALLVRELKVAVVFLTAYADRSTLERAKQVGPFGYILKPYSETDLHAAIEVALERHRLEQRAMRAERVLTATLRSIADAVIATDGDRRITFMNPMAEKLTGRVAEETIGHPLESIFVIADLPESSADTAVLEALHLHPSLGSRYDRILTAANGAQHYIEDSTAPIFDDADELIGTVVVFRDVGERKLQEHRRERAGHAVRRRLKDAAARDALTGLYNRRAWDQRIQAEDEHCARTQASAAVLVIDLNGLKHINDTQGHAAGDRFLSRAAATLLDAARAEDMVARLGGDEFAILAVDCDAEGVKLLVERVRESLHAADISASIGAATREAGSDLVGACQRADGRMYDAKRAMKAR